MKVSLWNRDVELTVDQVERMRVVIDKYISRLPGGQSVSYMIDTVRDETRIKFPTRMVDAEKMFEALGYKLRREYGPYNTVRRTYVTKGPGGEQEK